MLGFLVLFVVGFVSSVETLYYLEKVSKKFVFFKEITKEMEHAKATPDADPDFKQSFVLLDKNGDGGIDGILKSHAHHPPFFAQ